MWILVAVGDMSFQIVGTVDSMPEAAVMAKEYLAYGPDNSCVAPIRFEVHQRGAGGFYNSVVVL